MPPRRHRVPAALPVVAERHAHQRVNRAGDALDGLADGHGLNVHAVDLDELVTEPYCSPYLAPYCSALVDDVAVLVFPSPPSPPLPPPPRRGRSGPSAPPCDGGREKLPPSAGSRTSPPRGAEVPC